MLTSLAFQPERRYPSCLSTHWLQPLISDSPYFFLDRSYTPGDARIIISLPSFCFFLFCIFSMRFWVLNLCCTIFLVLISILARGLDFGGFSTLKNIEVISRINFSGSDQQDRHSISCFCAQKSTGCHHQPMPFPVLSYYFRSRNSFQAAFHGVLPVNSAPSLSKVCTHSA